MHRTPHGDEITWNEIDPWLHEGIAHLTEKDRVAVLLRFYDEMTFAQIGQAIGQTEDGARLRVGRAIGKLRQFLAKQGVVVTVAVFTALLAGNIGEPASAVPVPVIDPKLIGAFTGRGVSPAALGSHHYYLTQGVLKLMWIKQALRITATAVFGAAVAGTGIAFASHHARSLVAQRVITAATPVAQAPRAKSLPTTPRAAQTRPSAKTASAANRKLLKPNVVKPRLIATSAVKAKPIPAKLSPLQQLAALRLHDGFSLTYSVTMRDMRTHAQR